jgi:serine/threonine-protein kinase
VVCGGKQAYCAPEQFRGQSSEQSDLYAFGATLYFLLVGDDPPAITNLSLASKDIDVPLELESIIARSTALDARERYESARWIKLDLNEIRVDLEQ